MTTEANNVAEDDPPAITGFISDPELAARLGALERKVNAQREIGLCTLGVTLLVLYYITKPGS